MGYFISVLRDRIATFHSQGADSTVDGISINDLRKNLSDDQPVHGGRSAARQPPATA